MGLIGKIVSYLRGENSEITVDAGGGNNLTGIQVNPAGIEINPLETDYAALMRVQGSNKFVVVGYADTGVSPSTDPGELRLYSRNENSGAVVSEIILKNDGGIEIVNSNGSITVEANGEIQMVNSLGVVKLLSTGVVEANGATIDLLGDVKSATGVSLSFHTHTSAAPGSPTGPPIPTP